MLNRSTFALLVCLAACASGPEIPKSQQASQGESAQAQALFEKADALEKAASKSEDVLPVLKAWEDVLAVAPDHKVALVHAASFHYKHGADVLTDADKDARLATYLKGREYGLRAMATNPRFRAAYEKDGDMQKNILLLDKDDSEGMYWAGLNWAKWGELYGILRAAIDIPKVKALMDRVQELNTTYVGNGTDRFFMGYWVSIPGFAGRDPNKSKAAYDHAVQLSPDCIANHATFAFYYAKDKEDRPLFDSLLKKVLEAPADAPASPYLLINNLARAEAKRYADRAKEWFE